MKKHLKKAFSSIIKFPRISSKKALNGRNYNTTNYNVPKKTFLTIATDDIGFAKFQNDKINHKINSIKQFGIKPWNKLLNNNIYSPHWTSNKNLIKNIKKSIKLDTKEKYDMLNINNHKKFYKNETENIFNSYATAKNYKFRNELNRKYNQFDENKIDHIISNTKNLCFSNFMLDLLNNKRMKINEKEMGYDEALNKEDIILAKDIKKFENYKEQEKIKLKNLEIELIKKINQNGAIFEIMRQKSLEHHLILDEFKRIIKNIIRFKNYALFVYDLFGIEDSPFSKCDFGDNKIMVSGLKENEIEKIYKKIIFQTQKLFDKDFDDLIEELKLDPLKIYNVIKSKENMVLNLLSEKENIKFERNLCLKDFQKEIEIYENKYNNYMNEYISNLKEYEFQKEKIKQIEPNYKLFEFNKYFINLFYDIKKCLFKDEKTKKTNKDSLLYSNLVIPCLVQLQNKEILINKLIKQMESYEKNDRKFFYKKVNEIKLENKASKFYDEKEVLRIKENERIARILKKSNQIIITGKYKYNIPITVKRISSFSK